MADKKITALTEMLASGKNDAADFLHIIDYSASPVNKKITLASLFSTIETPVTAYGAHTHDIGPTSSISGLSVVVANTTPAAAAETEVIVNDDGNAYVDFRVQTSLNDNAIFVDSSLDSGAGNCNTITINGGAIASTKKVDFKVNSSTGILVHCDSTDHVVGIGTAAPDTAYLLDIAAVGGKSIKAAGTIDVTGSITATVDGTIGATAAGVLILPSVESITASSATAVVCSITHTTTLVTTSSNAGNGTLANGTIGQVKYISLVALSGGGDYVLTPATRNGYATITFDSLWDSVTLIYQTAGWTVVSSGGSIIVA